MSESELLRSCRVALESTGLWVERLQSGKVRVGGAWMQLCSKGTPDLVVWKPLVFLECKEPGEGLNPHQERWHARARSEGIRVAIVRSVGDALEAVRAAKAAA